MAIQVRVRQGGLSGATEADFTNNIPLWDVTESVSSSRLAAGMMFGNGSACQWEFVVDDDTSNVHTGGSPGALGARNVVTVSENAPGFNAWLARGRISSSDIGRGEKPWGNARQFHTKCDDANVDLRGLTLTTAWVRPSETGVARVLALGAAFLNGSPRPSTVITVDTTHLVPNTLTVIMPAKTYPAGTELNEILADCASTEGKLFGVVIHHVASASHLCLLYIDDADHTTYASTLSITDFNPDFVTSFPPIWDQGPGTLEDQGDVAHGVVSRWGSDDSQFVVVESTPRITDADYWMVPYNDSFSVNEAQATQRATARVDLNYSSRITHQATIRLPADKAHLLCAGMSIGIRAAGSGLAVGTTQTRRITQLKWEPISPTVGGVMGQYDAHMQLDRPVRVLPESKGLPVGPKPPSSPSLYAAAIGTSMPDPVTIGTGVTGGSGRTLYALIYVTHGTSPAISAVTYSPNNDHTNNATALTLVTSTTVNSFNLGILNLYKLDSPAAGTATASVKATITGDGACGLFYTDTTSLRTLVSAGGTGTSSSVSIAAQSGDLTLDLGGWVEMNASPVDAPTPGAGQTSQGTSTRDQAFGQADFGAGISSRVGGTSASWSWSASRAWYAGIFALEGTGSTEPVGGNSEGSTGTDEGTYALAGHVHPHGDLSAKTTETHHHAQSAKFTPTGTIAATNVQSAIAEVASESIQAAIVDAKGDLIVATAADTVARLAAPANGGRWVADSAQASGWRSVLDKYDATAAPTVNDDSGDGFSIGSKWVDVTNDHEYVALDVTVGAAVWKQTTAAGSGGSLTVQDEGTPLTTAADTLNFTGAGVTASGTTGTKTISIPGGSAWSRIVNQSGASFADWTSGTGTWASDGTVIQQTNTTASTFFRAALTASLDQGLPMVYQCDVRIDAVQGSSNQYAGLHLLSSGGSALGGPFAVLDYGPQQVEFGNSGSSLTAGPAMTIALSTWYTIKFEVHGLRLSIYVDGVFSTNGWVAAGSPSVGGNKVGLVCYNTRASFRNITLDRMALP